MRTYKRIDKRPTRGHGCSQPPVPDLPSGSATFLAATIIAWVALPGFLPAESASDGDGPPAARGDGESAVLATPPRVAPEEAAALKAEEMAAVQTLARDFPESVDVMVLMGSVYHRHGHAGEALRLWQQVLQRDPNRADVYKSMGWFAMQKGEYEQAISHWRDALKISPRMPDIRNGIARALMGLGRHEEAIEELLKDVETSRTSASYFLLGQEYLQQREYEKAKDSYEEAIALQPDFTSAYYGLFTACARLGQRGKAQEYMAVFKKLKADDMKVLKDRNDTFNDLVNMREDAATTFLQAGQIYHTGGQLARAERLLERAVNLNPQNPACHLNYGTVSARLGHFKEAEEAFRKVIALAPDRSRGYSALSHVLLQVGKNLQEARQMAEKAVALEPVAFNFYVLSWACDKNGDSAGAFSAIRRAVELEPDNPMYRRVYDLKQKQK